MSKDNSAFRFATCTLSYQNSPQTHNTTPLIQLACSHTAMFSSHPSVDDYHRRSTDAARHRDLELWIAWMLAIMLLDYH